MTYTYSPSPTPAGAQTWRWRWARAEIDIRFWRYGVLRITVHGWGSFASTEIPVHRLFGWWKAAP